MNDDDLMAALAEAVSEADTTERRRQAARAAFTWRTVDEELAELLHDSALEVGAAVRGAGTLRTLAFTLGGVTLELELDGEELLGQVLAIAEAVGGDGPAMVTVSRPDHDEITVEADASGFFRIPDFTGGPTRFVVTKGEWRLTTPWITL